MRPTDLAELSAFGVVIESLRVVRALSSSGAYVGLAYVASRVPPPSAVALLSLSLAGVFFLVAIAIIVLWTIGFPLFRRETFLEMSLKSEHFRLFRIEVGGGAGAGFLQPAGRPAWRRGYEDGTGRRPPGRGWGERESEPGHPASPSRPADRGLGPTWEAGASRGFGTEKTWERLSKLSNLPAGSATRC